MKSLQEYREKYRSIASGLGYTGDSVELLVQLLANASYIEEVENASYTLEASLENAGLMNSKIQRCMDLMYSVSRGYCPRVILKFKPTKFQSFRQYEEIATSSNFRVYYLGYWNGGESEGDALDGFTYGDCTINPSMSSEYTILGLISPTRYDREYTIAEVRNNLYVTDQLLSGLSNDLDVSLLTGGNIKVTRSFSEHITGIKEGTDITKALFDLTTTDYGSRLYFSGVLESSDILSVRYFKMAKVSDFQESELKRILIKGTQAVDFTSDFIESRNLSDYISSTGVIILPEVLPDSSPEVHYTANKFRFSNSIVRSNEELGFLLQRDYPDKVKEGGTECVFNQGDITIYYIPESDSSLLTATEKNKFRDNRKAYYISDNLTILPAAKVKVVLVFNIVLYKQSTTLDSDIADIVKKYSYKFGISFKNFNTDPGNELKMEMMSIISKNPDVKYVKGIQVALIGGSSVLDLDSDSDVPVYYEITSAKNTEI